MELVGARLHLLQPLDRHIVCAVTLLVGATKTAVTLLVGAAETAHSNAGPTKTRLLQPATLPLQPKKWALQRRSNQNQATPTSNVANGLDAVVCFTSASQTLDVIFYMLCCAVI